MKASAIVPVDFSARQILPTSAAVRAPRFSTSRHWAISRTARELVDQIHAELHVPMAPRAEPVDSTESVVLAGNEIFTSWRSSAGVVRQHRTVVDLATLPELSIAEPFVAVPDTSIRSAAGEALAAINNRRPAARRVAPAPAATPAWVSGLAVLLVVGCVAYSVWRIAAALS